MVSCKVKDQAYRQRRQERPNEPQTIDDIDLEKYPDLIVDKRGDKLCHGPTKSGCVVVMSKVQATIGGRLTSAMVDCTFSITCPPWFQTLTLLGRVEDSKYPIAAALLPNKLETTYIDVLSTIQDICAENGTEMDVLFVHCDCKFALLNAIKNVFPNAQIRLCR